jgi:hypothetical protein
MNRLNAAQSKGRRVDLVEAATANSPIVVANSLDDDSADDDSLNLPIPVDFRRSQQSQNGQNNGNKKRDSFNVKDLDVDAFTLASPYLLFDSPRSSTKKIECNRASFLAGGAFGISQRIVISVLLALVCIGAVGAIAVGVETAQVIIVIMKIIIMMIIITMIIIKLLMPVQQKSFTHLRALLIFTDRGIWAQLISIVDGRSYPLLG